MAIQLQHSGGSSGSSVIELSDYSVAPGAVKDTGSHSRPVGARSESSVRRSQDGHRLGDTTPLPPPNTAVKAVQRWNQSRIQMFRTATTMFTFITMGANDASYGALIAYIAQYYNLTYTVVSLIFLSPFIGYSLSALLNNMIHLKIGQRGVAIAVGLCHSLAFLIIALHPPYPVLVIAFAVTGLGNGLADSAWNAWIGNMANANEVLGFLHGFYGLGAVMSPLIGTTMVTRSGLQWYHYYYFMLGLGAVELFTTAAAFWAISAKKYKEALSSDAEGSEVGMKEALLKAPWARVTWLCALFLLGYVGIEVSLGGWIVVFMQKVRHGEDFASGMTATGFWLGLTVGRVTLGFVTPRIGEKLAISVYLVLVMGLELIFWLVPQFYVSAVAVALQGYFLGPLFPGAIVVATRLLPRHLHVTGIGFASALGGGGAAILPFVVGAVAQAKGVEALQPIILAFLAVIFAIWLALPRLHAKNE